MFLGFAMGIFMISLPERYGRSSVLNNIVLPGMFIGMILSSFSNEYYSKCVGMFMVGLFQVRTSILVNNAVE